MNDNIALGEALTFSVDGRPVKAYRGQTIVAALYASGTRTLRRTRGKGAPRGVYCGMGVCYDCIVKVNDETVRACMTFVEDGMRVRLLDAFEQTT